MPCLFIKQAESLKVTQVKDEMDGSEDDGCHGECDIVRWYFEVMLCGDVVVMKWCCVMLSCDDVVCDVVSVDESKVKWMILSC